MAASVSKSPKPDVRCNYLVLQSPIENLHRPAARLIKRLRGIIWMSTMGNFLSNVIHLLVNDWIKWPVRCLSIYIYLAFCKKVCEKNLCFTLCLHLHLINKSCCNCGVNCGGWRHRHIFLSVFLIHHNSSNTKFWVRSQGAASSYYSML